MNILLYKPLHYDLNECANDINFYPDEGIINDAINSFFLVSAPRTLRWLETFRRECNRRENYNDYSPAYWFLSKSRKEVFKKLEVVSVY